MITHHLEVGQDIFKGYFADGYGKRLYSRPYDPNSMTITVEHRNVGRRRDPSCVGIDRLSDGELRDRLIALVQEIGEDLRANRPVQG